MMNHHHCSNDCVEEPASSTPSADSSVSRLREREEKSAWRLTEQSATTPYFRGDSLR